MVEFLYILSWRQILATTLWCHCFWSQWQLYLHSQEQNLPFCDSVPFRKVKGNAFPIIGMYSGISCSGRGSRILRAYSRDKSPLHIVDPGSTGAPYASVFCKDLEMGWCRVGRSDSLHTQRLYPSPPPTQIFPQEISPPPPDLSTRITLPS